MTTLGSSRRTFSIFFYFANKILDDSKMQVMEIELKHAIQSSTPKFIRFYRQREKGLCALFYLNNNFDFPKKKKIFFLVK